MRVLRRKATAHLQRPMFRLLSGRFILSIFVQIKARDPINFPQYDSAFESSPSFP